MTILNKDELHKQVVAYLESFDKNFFAEPKSKWSDAKKKDYKNAHSLIYCRMRAELKARMADAWFNTLTAGNLRAFCNKHGMLVNRRGDVNCTRLADDLLKYYLKTTFIPKVEKELGIKGIKVSKNASARAYNCLDFSVAEVVKNN